MPPLASRMPLSRIPLAALLACAACALSPPPAPAPPAAPSVGGAPAPLPAVPQALPPPAVVPAPPKVATARVPPKAAIAPETATAPKPAPSKAPSPKPAPQAAIAPSPATARAPLDVKALEQRLKETSAIGVMTKLSLKNQVDDLLEQFREFHDGRLKATLADLRRPFDLLLMKVLSLLQDSDPGLARDIHDSRDALWALLADPDRFRKLST